MPDKATGTLDDTGVLVTRPAHQAGPLIDLIHSAGGRAFHFPTIAIEPVQSDALEQVLAKINQFDLAIFVSANAVAFGLAAMTARQYVLPSTLSVAAVGAATARALAAQGHAPDVVPDEDYRSESLLAHPALQQVRGRKIVIFRGQGGRELLAETLNSRGASISYAECYRRVRPQADPSEIEHRWSRGDIHIVTATSAQGLDNLLQMLGENGKALLRKSPIVVISQRIAESCRRLGLQGEVLIATEAGDAAIVATIETWRRRQKTL